MLPAIAYTLEMYRRTGNFYGINESLFSTALAAMVFSIFSCQPITIVGITGLIALFNYTTYDIIAMYDASIYPMFMCWVGIWGAIFHWIAALCNLSDYMRYVTDFSSQSFAMYVGIIYVSMYTTFDRNHVMRCMLTEPLGKGVEELINEFNVEGLSGGYLSTVIAICYFLTIFALEWLGGSDIGWTGSRMILADYAYVVCSCSCNPLRPILTYFSLPLFSGLDSHISPGI